MLFDKWILRNGQPLNLLQSTFTSVSALCPEDHCSGHSLFLAKCQVTKQTFECQYYTLLQAHLDRRAANNLRIENYSVT